MHSLVLERVTQMPGEDLPSGICRVLQSMAAVVKCPHMCHLTEPLLWSFYDFLVQRSQGSNFLDISSFAFPSPVIMLQSTSLKALATFTLAWVAWRLLRRYLFPHPLDRVPGLKPRSWIAGAAPNDILLEIRQFTFPQEVLPKYLPRMAGTFMTEWPINVGSYRAIYER